MILQAENLSVGYGGRRVQEHMSFSIGEGEILCILGPNGVGKTTLFKTLLGLLHPQEGSVLLDGRDVRRLNPRELAKKLAYVPQSQPLSLNLSVLDVVLLGRLARVPITSSPGEEDKRIALEMLEKLNISHLAEKRFSEISGGERQLAVIAKALAQQPGIIIMDEPTSSLDFGNQILVLEKIRELRSMGVSVIVTTHYPEHAFLCSTRVMLLRRGQPFQSGTCEEVVTEKNLREVYGVSARIVDVEGENGTQIKGCVPLPRADIG